MITFLEYLIFINFNLFIFSLVVWVLNGFKTSEINLIRIIQTLWFLYLLIVFFSVLFYFGQFFFLSVHETAYMGLASDKPIDNVLFMSNDDTNNTNNTGDTDHKYSVGLTLGDAGAKGLENSLYSVGRNMGLATSTAGIAGAVASGIQKAALPPATKFGLIVGGGLAGAAIHKTADALGRYSYSGDSNGTSSNSGDSNGNPSNSGVSSSGGGSKNTTGFDYNKSPLEDSEAPFNIFSAAEDTSILEVLVPIEVLVAISLYIVFILSIQIFSKFILPDNLNLSHIFGVKLNRIFNKILNLNKKASNFWIVLALILLLIILFSANTFLILLIDYLKSFV